MPQWTALKQARLASKKTLAQLAEASGGYVSAAAISHWEMTGMTPSFQALRGICLATGTTPNELFGVGDRSYPYDSEIAPFTEEELEMMRGAIAEMKATAKQHVMEEDIHRVDPDALNKVKVCWAIEEKIDMLESWSRLR